MHTPRSTLASCSGQGGAALEPLFVVLKRFVLSSGVLHADETPVAKLDPGAGKTRRACVRACARGAFDAAPGTVWDFCIGRGAQYPMAFLGAADDDPHQTPGWRGTLVGDKSKAYEQVIVAEPGRIAARCLIHARRRFDELLRDNGRNVVAMQALRHIAQIYRVKRELATLTSEERLTDRNIVTRPPWEKLPTWLR